MAERSSLTQVVQIAPESTAGTAVTTGFKQMRSLSIEPSPSVEMDQFRPAGQKYKSFTVLGKEWVTASMSGRATFTEIVYALSSVIDAPTITTPASATLARSWVFESDENNDDAPKTFTVRHGSSLIADEFTYGLVNEFGFNFTRSSIEVSGSMMGKALDTSGVSLASGGDLTSLALIPVIPTQVSIYLDDSAANLGDTKLTRVLSAEWSLGSRFSPVWPIDASLEATFAAIIESEPDLTCSLSMEADSNGVALLSAMRTSTRKFLRIEAIGAEIDAAGTAPNKNYRLTIDTAVEIVDTPGFSDNDGVYTIDWNFVGVVDETWTKAFSIEVINKLTAL